MERSALSVGMLVQHPAKPEWGVGKILTLSSSVARIHFKNDSEPFRTLKLDLVALQPTPIQADPVLHSLPPFDGEKFAGSTKRVSRVDGLKKFTEQFPTGF